MHCTGHHFQTLWQQSLLFMTSHALYSRHHMHYIWYVIYCVWYHILSMYDCSQCLFLWHYTLYLYDKSTLYGIKHSVMTIQWCTSQPLCLISHTMYCVITSNVSVFSNPVYVCHHLHYMYEIICNTYDITSTLYDIALFYLWHQVHSIWHHIHYIWIHVHCICVITPTLSMISQPIYVW